MDPKQCRKKKDVDEKKLIDVASPNAAGMVAETTPVSDSSQVQHTRAQKSLAARIRGPYNPVPEAHWDFTYIFHDLSHDDAESKMARILDIIKHSMEVTGGETNE